MLLKLCCSVALSLGFFGPGFLLVEGQAVPVKTVRWTGRPLKIYTSAGSIIANKSPPDDNCDDSPVTIDTALILEFEGYPERVTTREIWVLQDQFIETFKSLTSQSCDHGTSFTIDEIIISPKGIVPDMGSRRALTGGTISNVPVVSYTASVRATCTGQGCPNNNMLFRSNNSNNNYNRALQGADKENRDLAGNCAKCTAPTEQQFIQAYNNDILKSELVINLEGFVGLVQLTAVPCSDEIEEFEADLDIDWISEPSITAEETTFLEQQVVDVYNGLGLMLCNPDFTTLEEAELVQSTPVGRLRQLNMHSSEGGRNLAPRRFRNRFKARGRCRGKDCRAKAKRLFDEGVRRLLQMLASPSTLDQHRLLQVANSVGCFCDPAAADDPELQRAPTAEEFTAAYAAVVAAANLPNVYEVLETTVPPPLPTIAPSPPVPPPPVPAPSRRPTPRPTPAPSISMEPSVSIKPSVSSQPSPMPSVSMEPSTSLAPTLACDVSDIEIECCTDADCENEFQTCVAFACVMTGSLTFRLTWTGDDDLDLHVITPSGNEIYYSDTTYDGGQLDMDSIPLRDGYPTKVDWVENIFWPMNESVPVGSYTYFVQNYNEVDAPDPWELKVLVSGEVVGSKTGVVSGTGSNSTYFEYVVY